MKQMIKRNPEEEKIRALLIEECVRRANARKARSPTKKKDKLQPSTSSKDKVKPSTSSKPVDKKQVAAKEVPPTKDSKNKLQVELIARNKRKLVALGPNSTMQQIIDTFGKRVIGDGCIILFEGTRLDKSLKLCQLPGSAPWRLVLDKEE